MNIIANDCAGAYIYRDSLKCDFMNPFIWSSIDIENFSKLIQNYDTLDFKNIKCELIHNESGICKQGSYIPKVTIDNQVEVGYFHYIQNDKYTTPTKIDGYTMCNDIIKYTVDSYMRRIEKMTEHPIFIWDVTKCKWYNKSNINPVDVFKKITTDYSIVIYSPFLENAVNSNLILLNKKNGSFEVNVSASNIYKTYLSRLL